MKAYFVMPNPYRLDINDDGQFKIPSLDKSIKGFFTDEKRKAKAVEGAKDMFGFDNLDEALKYSAALHAAGEPNHAYPVIQINIADKHFVPANATQQNIRIGESGANPQTLRLNGYNFQFSLVMNKKIDDVHYPEGTFDAKPVPKTTSVPASTPAPAPAVPAAAKTTPEPTAQVKQKNERPSKFLLMIGPDQSEKKARIFAALFAATFGGVLLVAGSFALAAIAASILSTFGLAMSTLLDAPEKRIALMKVPANTSKPSAEATDAEAPFTPGVFHAFDRSKQAANTSKDTPKDPSPRYNLRSRNATI